MISEVHTHATELILSAMHTTAGIDGLPCGFFFGPPGSLRGERRLGTTVYFSSRGMIRAVLFIRKHGLSHLGYLRVNDISRMITDFVCDNYWHLSEETLFKRFECTYAEYVSHKTKSVMANALAASPIFSPNLSLTLFPLVPVRVMSDFTSDIFFLIAPGSLVSQLPTARWLEAERFPPLKNWKGKPEVPTAWLGVRSPTVQSSIKMRSAILGALALTPQPRQRYTFSMRQVFGGWCEIDDGVTTSLTDAHTPPLAEDIVISEIDHAWLSMLAGKLTTTDEGDRRQIRALEYFYRAWPLDQSERFPVLCMTLDAVFGEVSQSTSAVLDAVASIVGPRVERTRLRALMKLRASVIHGGAPDVYDSSKYARYYEEYGDDPVFDLEVLVARCLRKIIFCDVLPMHPDPYEQMIADMQAKGRLPERFTRPSILDEAD